MKGSRGGSENCQSIMQVWPLWRKEERMWGWVKSIWGCNAIWRKFSEVAGKSLRQSLPPEESFLFKKWPSLSNPTIFNHRLEAARGKCGFHATAGGFRVRQLGPSVNYAFCSRSSERLFFMAAQVVFNYTQNRASYFITEHLFQCLL